MSALSLPGSTSSKRGNLGAIVEGNLMSADVVGCRGSESYTAEVYTIAVAASPSNATTYSATVSSARLSEDVVVSYTTDASATQAELVTGLKSALNQDARVGGLLKATESGTTITLTGRDSATFTVVETADPDSKLTVANTVDAADFATYGIGRFVALTPSVATGVAGYTAAKPSAGTLPALGLTLTHAASQTYTIDLTYTDQDGKVQTAVVEWASGAAAADTDNNAETALGNLGWTGITVTNPAEGSVILTGRIGESIAYENASATGAADLTAAVTAGDARSMLGMVLEPSGLEIDPTTGVAASYVRAGTSFDALRAGSKFRVAVEYPGSAPTVGAAVYVETAAGANNGRPYPASSATRELLPGASWAMAVDANDSTLSHIIL